VTNSELDYEGVIEQDKLCQLVNEIINYLQIKYLEM
jgi:hypothetical protein